MVVRLVILNSIFIKWMGACAQTIRVLLILYNNNNNNLNESGNSIFICNDVKKINNFRILWTETLRPNLVMLASLHSN